MNWAILVFVFSFLLLLLGGMPIAWAMLSATVLWMLVSDELVFLLIMPDKIFQGIDVFILMAVPLFILVGELLNAGRITDRLVHFANQFFGWISGGLAQVNIGSSILFSGITGVALGDIAALGRVFIPAMVKQGYSAEYAAAVTASSSIIGPMVPPFIDHYYLRCCHRGFHWRPVCRLCTAGTVCRSLSDGAGVGAGETPRLSGCGS